MSVSYRMIQKKIYLKLFVEANRQTPLRFVTTVDIMKGQIML